MARVAKKRAVTPAAGGDQLSDKSTSRTDRAALPKKRKAQDSAAEDGSQLSTRAGEAAVKKQRGTIHSFFNTATELQKLSTHLRNGGSPQRQSPAIVLGQEDIIDISDDDLLFANTTKAALRKQKLDQGNPLCEAKPSSSSTGPRFRKSDKLEQPPSDPEAIRPWTEQYPPLDLSELAVHKKKVTQVRSLLEESLSTRARPRLIVLKGPAGTGKTTTVKVLAHDIGFTIREWENPVGVMKGNSFMSASAQFEDFLLRGATFATLDFAVDSTHDKAPKLQKVTTPSHQQVVLIEEFPTIIGASSNTLQAFRSMVVQLLSARAAASQVCTPVVMIISETLLTSTNSPADNFTAHRLLGPAILTHPLTALVEFNNIAPTILTKALETVVLKEARKSGRRRTPGSQVLKQLAETGDVRSAVSSLEFMCLKGDADDDTWSAKIAFTKPKKANKAAPPTKRELESLALIGNRGSTLGIFHAVGKVVYNKRQNFAQGQDATMWRHGSMPDIDPEDLLIELGTDVAVFVAALHENFALSCASQSHEETLDSLNTCLDSLSDADLMQSRPFNGGSSLNMSASAPDSQRGDDIAFQIAVRGLQSGLPYPVKRGSMPGDVQPGRNGAFKMFYPTSIKIWSKRQTISDNLDLIIAQNPTTSARGASKSDGVESWQREKVDATSTSSLIQPQAARLETLLERLPIAVHILDARPGADLRLLTLIKDLTSFRGPGIRPDEDEEVDDQGQLALATDGPGPTTRRSDVPHADVVRGSDGHKSAQNETEGAGLRIPVEHDIEKLVLSDDDIIDDFD